MNQVIMYAVIDSQRPTMRAPDWWESTRFQAVLWLEVSSGKMALSRPAHQRVTPTVGRLSSIELKASKMITMSKDHELDFLQLVSETFDSVFKKYAFRFQKESIWSSRGRYHTTSAVKGDIELVFYLAEISEFCHLSIQIRVSGKSAEKVTSKTFRNISIGEIARRIDPNYSHRDNEIRTKQDLKEALEAGKECLLRYCEGILLGDVSSWLNVVNAYIEEIRKAGLKVE